MIIIIVGQSASGKSTYVAKNYLEKKMERYDTPFKYTISENNILLGHYGLERRCTGTDTMSMSILPKLIENFKQLLNIKKTIICEGDRINNIRFFDFIKTLNVPVKVILFECSIKESLERLKKTSSKIGETFVKTTKTKSKNMFVYAQKLGFENGIINTDTKKYGLDNF